jgi:hypothetical protein
MKTCLALMCLASVDLAQATVPVTIASSGQRAAPTITITNPHNGATVYGSSVTVHVSVSNFKLVPPVYLNPPKLIGIQGHIHYVLDSLANFQATRDATIALSHTWTNVSPGRHTIIVYLATSQHAQFPNTREARVTIRVVASAPINGAGASQVTSMPNTGGAVDARVRSLDLASLLAAVMVVVIGLTMLITPSYWNRP